MSIDTVTVLVIDIRKNAKRVHFYRRIEQSICLNEVQGNSFYINSSCKHRLTVQLLEIPIAQRIEKGILLGILIT